MVKDDLIGIYRTALNNCKLTYASMVLWAHDDMPSVFEAFYEKLEIPKPFPDLLPILRDPKVLKISCEELYDATHRAAIKEMFEITKHYCETTSQFPQLKAQPWYQFWRILRNCFSHDLLFRFNAYDLKQLPLTWAGTTLDAGLEGKHLTHGRMSRDKIRELLETAAQFVEHDLK